MTGPVFSFRTVVIINLTEPINDAGFIHIVGGHLEFHTIANGEANEAFAHFPGDMREHIVFVRQRDPEHGPG